MATKTLLTIGFLAFMLCFFSMATAISAQENCSDCRGIFKECRADTRTE